LSSDLQFRECEFVSADEPLRQGDVVQAYGEPVDQWDARMVVVTADCDLARRKHAGRVSCVPAVTLHQYLSLFYLPGRLEKVAAPLADQIVAMIRKAREQVEAVAPISRERALAWVHEVPATEIAASLGIDGSVEEFRRKVDAYIQTTAAIDSDDFDSQWVNYARRGGLETDDRIVRERSDKLQLDVTGLLKKLPGDALFLRSLGESLDSGFVCYLRVVRDLRESAISTRYSGVGHPVTHVRTSRLSSPYLYALTQQLGAVFSAIGLPEEYEQARDSTSHEVSFGLWDREKS
jgi:hypothetical protein